MKTLKQIKKTIFTGLLLLMLVFPSITNAQNLKLGNCSKKGLSLFAWKNGSVYSLAPGIFEKFEAHYNRVDVSVLKTGGRARTQVNIYLNNVYQGHLTFENGDYKRIETYSLNNAKGKTVKVEIVNQSATNRFDYKLRLYHSQKRQIYKSERTLLPGESYNTSTLSCTKKIKFTFKRKEGNAKFRFIAYHSNNRTIRAVNINSNETTKTVKLAYPNEDFDLHWKIINTDTNNYVKVEITEDIGNFKGKKIKKVIHRTNH